MSKVMDGDMGEVSYLPQPVTSITGQSSDLEIGSFALTLFWQAAQQLNPSMPGDWAAFLELLRRAYYPRDASEAPQGYTTWKQVYYPNASSKALAAFIDGLGLSIRSVEMNLTPDHIQSAMQTLAGQGQGTIPTNSNAFFGVIQNEAEAFSFYDAAAFVVTESAKDIAHGAQVIGEDIIETGASILKYRNYIIAAAVIGAGFMLYKYGHALLPMLKRNPDDDVETERNPKGKRWLSPSKIQSLMFHKALFTEDEALDWARKHRFAWRKVEEGKNYWRIRQHSPSFFDDFRTIDLGEKSGVRAVIGPSKRLRFSQ
jgi:hypothetical protein